MNRNLLYERVSSLFTKFYAKLYGLKTLLLLLMFFSGVHLMAQLPKPKITVRFANPQYDCETNTYCLDVEFNSDTPGEQLFGMNVRFFYETSKLEIKEFTNFEGGYEYRGTYPIPVFTSPNAGPAMFGFPDPPATYINEAVELRSIHNPIYISTTGWTKLYTICFDVLEDYTGIGEFCPSVIWDLRQNPYNGGFLTGSDGVVITLVRDLVQNTSKPADEFVEQFNWDYIGDGSSMPYGQPEKNECLDTYCSDLEFVKTAVIESGKTAAELGDEITYTFTVTNTGIDILTGVEIIDPMVGLTFNGATTGITIAVGGSYSVTATYIVTQSDVDAGHVLNQATVSNDQTVDAPSSSNPNNPGHPGDDPNTTPKTEVPTFQAANLSFVKTAVIESGKTAAELGDEITYTFTVTNTGNVTLTGVEITDPMVGLTFNGATTGITIAVGGSYSVTATYIVTQSDVDAGHVLNQATVSNDQTVDAPSSGDPNNPGHPGDDPNTTPKTVVPTSQAANLSFVKTAVIESGKTAAELGDEITYTFTVTNTGNVTLTGVEITDPMVGLTFNGATTGITIAVGGSYSVTATYIVTQSDVDAGHVLNQATVSNDQTVDAPSSGDPNNPGHPGDDPNTTPKTVVPTSQAANLSFVKTAVIESGKTAAELGDEITYTFTVTNTGNVTLTGVEITDPMVGLTFNGATTDITIAVGGSYSVTATYIVTQSDVDAGHVLNQATVSNDQTVDAPSSGEPNNPGHPGDNPNTTPKTEVPIDQNPALTVTKTVAESSYASVGDVLHYIITVENTGNVTIINIEVTDDLTGEVWTIDELGPKAIYTVTTTYTITPNDLVAGSVVNHVTASGEDPNGEDVGDDGTVTVNVDKSDLKIEKIVSNATPDVGDEVTFTITVTNLGPNKATGVEVVDQLPNGYGSITDISNGGVFETNTITWSDLTVVVGTPVVLTFKATILEPGIGVSYTNHVAITSSDQYDPEDGNNVDEEVLTPRQADLSLTKIQINPSNLPLPNNPSSVSSLVEVTPSVIAAGERIYYFLNVQNAGPNNAIDILLTDAIPTGITNMEYSVNFGNNWNAWTGSLSKYEFISSGAAYFLIRGNVDPGATGIITNTASINSGKTYDPDTTNNEDSIVTTVHQVADLSLSKKLIGSSSGVGYGGDVEYEITVINYGPSDALNVTIEDIIDATYFSSVYYSTDGGSTYSNPWTGSLNIGTLAYGASVSIRIKGYDLQSVAPDPLVNTATVSTTVTDPDPDNNEDTISTPLGATVDLSIVKTCPSEVISGTEIIYEIQVENTSDIYNAIGVHIHDLLDANIFKNQRYSLDSINWIAWSGASPKIDLNAGELQIWYILADVDSDAPLGIYTNTATVDSDTPDSDESNNTSSCNTDIKGEADIRIVKTLITAPEDVVAGSQIEFLLSYYNDGPSDATIYLVADTIAAGLTNVTASPCGSIYSPWLGSYDAGRVVAGGSGTIIIRGTLDENYIGVYTNTATVKSDVYDPDESNNTSTITIDVFRPSVSLTKEGTLAMNVVAPNDRLDAGDQIHYTFTVTNTGNAALTNVAVTDYNSSVIIDNGGVIGPLAIGATVILTGTYTLTQADIDAGTFTNTASVTGKYNDLDYTDEDVDVQIFEQAAGITLVKEVISSAPYALGDTIEYQFTLSNQGNVTLTNIVFTDILNGVDLSSGLVWSESKAEDNQLEVGEVWTATAIYTITQSDIDAGVVSNTAHVTSKDPNGNDIEDTSGSATGNDDPTVIILDQSPGIALIKEVISSAPYALDDTIEYQFTLSNEGDVTLTNIVFTDILNGVDLSSGLVWSESKAEDNQLEVGEVWTATAIYIITQSDIDAGVVSNTAHVTSKDPNGNDIEDTSGSATGNDDPTVTILDQSPGIALIKEVISSAPYALGDTIEYQFTLSNEGDVTLTNIVFTDILNGIDLSSGLVWSESKAEDNQLEVGEVWTATAIYIITQSDIDAGVVSNTAHVTSKDPNGNDIEDTSGSATGNDDPTVTILDQSPGIALIKEVISSAPYALGDTIEYQFTLSNEGDVTLTNIVFTDILNGVDLSIGLVWSESKAEDNQLEVGEVWTATAIYTITQSDIDAGVVSNTAHVTSKDPNGNDIEDTSGTATGNDDPTVIILDQNPGIALIKEVISSAPYALDDTIEYQFTLSNEGDVTLTNIVFTDILNGVDLSIGLVWSESKANDDQLEVGEVWTATAIYIITQSDIDAGVVSNTAHVTSKDPKGNDIEDTSGSATGNDDPTVTILDQSPGIALIKEVISSAPYALGDTIEYQFTLSNEGDVTLTNIVFTDILNGIDLSSGLVWSESKAEDNQLEVGEVWTATAIYIITQSDIDAGVVSNTAHVTSKDPNGNDIEDTSGSATGNDDPTVTILDQSPGIALIKEVISSAPYALDDTIEYQFTLSNEGDVTLTNIVFTDILNGVDLGSGLVWSESKANDDQLEVGEVWTATAIYIITQSDIDAGVVSNTAHVTSKDPNGNDIEDTSGSATDNDDPTVTILDQSPGIALIKEVISSAPYALDDTIEYQFTLSNEGDVTLTNIVFTDILNGVDLGSGLVWSESKAEDNQLEVGEVWTATAIYIITQSDIDAGVVSNTAHVTSKDPNGNDIEDTSGSATGNDDPTVTILDQSPGIALIKEVISSAPYALDDTIEYQFTLSNEGDVTLTNIVFTDILNGVDLGSGLVWSESKANDDQLEVGEVWTATAIYTITQSDIDAGVVSNTAHVTSKDPNGNDIEDTSGTSADNDDPTVTPITQNPALTVTKTAVESSFASVGDVLHYTIKVENTGNVTIINIEVKDDLTGGEWYIDELGPNDIYTVTTTYTITEDDLDAGNVLNHVIAFGKDPNEEAVEGEDEVNVPYGLPNVICPDDFSVCENEEQFTLTGGLPLGGTYYGAGVVGGADFNPAFADVGEHLITYEAITNSGIESCTFTITVLDSPDVTCPSDISICITTPEVVLTGGHPSGGVYSGTGVVSDTFVTADAGAGEHLISYTYVDVNGCENACDFVITVVDEPSVDAGPDIIICGDGPVEICGVVSNTSNFVWQVVGGNAMGTFDDDCSICTTFTPSEAALEQGFVIISLVVFPQSPCTLPRVDIMVITFSSAPTAFAGSEGSICYPDLTEWALTDASADHYSSLLWSSTGTGSFDDPSSLTPIYTVSAEDVLVGSVTLTLTAYPIEPCTDPAISSVALYIAPSPTVYAGIDTIICQFECCSGGDAGSYCLSAEAANYSSLLWSSSGDGTFADPSQLNTCYVIGSDDMVAGVVTLTLTAYPIEPCAEPVQSQILLTIQPAPIVDAGPDATICVGQTYTLSGSSALYSSSLYWDFAYMGEGDGVWDDHTVLHPTYTPGPGDLHRGYVTLILVGFGYDPCYSVIDVDVMKLYFESVPDVSFEAYPVCFGTEVSFINLSSSGTWLWDFGDGSTSDLKDPTHLYDAPGVYSVCLTVSVNTGCSDTFCGEVEVYSLPEVNAGSYPTLTIYDDITLQPIVSGATPLQFEWSPSTYLSDPQVERPIFGPAPLGVYTLTLTVTDDNGCSAQAETIIVVGPSEIIANDDIGTPVNGYDGGVVVANVLSNDLLNGSAPTLSLVDLTIVTPPSHSGIVLDLLTGEVTVAPSTPAGTYTFTYQICEILNPTNCDDALVTVVVTPPDILAVDDDFSGNPINGMDGGVAGNVLDNDLLNDDPVDAGDITISVVSDGGLTGVIIDSDGNLNVPPSTPAGTYTVTYEICEIINPTNCDQAVITIVVTASTIIANDDIGAPVNSDDGGVAVANVLSNDLLNGSEPMLSLVSLTIVTPPSHSGIVLDLLTGEVTVAAGTPVGIYTFTYQICEILNPTNCDDAMVTVVVIEDPAVLFCFNDVTATTGSEFAYCEGQTITVTLCDVLAGLAPFDICWEVNGSPYCDYGVGIDDILFSDQLPAGNYEIVITSITDSLGVNVIDVSVYHATVIVHADPSVEAGEDDVVCAGSSYELLGSLASNYSSLLWSGGDGVFSDPTALHPTYTLGANDLAVGSVTLCLSAEPLDPCTVPASDCLVLTIQDTPTVSLDSDGVVCEDEFFALEPVVSNYSEVQWSGGVDGFFLDENDPFTSYYPGEEDIAAGSIELCIEVYAVSPCIGSVTACITLNIEVAPVANAGVNDTICEGDSYHLSTATATNYGSVEWLSSGDGTFDDNTVVNATYTPGEGDIANGSVILLLHAYPESVCTTVAESAMLLTIVGYPTLDMDSEVKLTCEDYDVAAGAWIPFQIDVVASNYGSVLWTTTGDGYFDDPTDINSVYYVGLNDIWQPYFELCLTIEGVGACNASVSKCVTVEIPQQLIYYDQDGWWGLSSYLDPYDPPVPTVVDPIVLIPGSQHLITMVDRAGKYFWAEDIPPKNQLGDWKPIGYKIKMKNTPACLPIYGDSLTNQTFNISGLFTFLPVLTNVPVAITDLFADHLNKVRMIYDWPTARLWTEYASDFDILQPGKAYLLVNKVTSNYSVTFPDYDPSAPHRYPTLKSSNYFTSPWSDIVNTAVPHVVVFDKSVQSKLCIGDVIGAFNHTGICYGSVEFNGVGEFMKLVVMGDAPFSSGTVGFKESEIIYFKLYRPSTGETFNLSFIYDQDFPVTDDHFTENGIARVVDFKSEAIVVSDLDLSNHVIVYPNPASTNLTVESSKPITNVVMLNSLGQRVLSSDIMGVTGVVDLNGLSRGMYVMHLYFESGHHTIKRIIIE